MESFNDYSNRVRDLINIFRVQNNIMKDMYNWNQVCSSLDIIEDTDLAINEYLKLPDNDNTGFNYLIIYGIFQVLYVQQDAFRNLSEALSVSFPLNPELKKIRDIRNSSTGHPTKIGGGIKRKYSFMVRMSLSTFRFSLMISSPGENMSNDFLNYNVIEIIDSQRNILKGNILEIINHLEKAEMEHREKHKDNKLVDIFHQTLSYHFGKISEYIHGTSPQILAEGNFKIIKKIYNDFKIALAEREIYPQNDFVSMDINRLEYPMKKLDDYFNDAGVSYEDAEIYLFYIQKNFDELKQIAKEIDDDYSSNV